MGLRIPEALEPVRAALEIGWPRVDETLITSAAGDLDGLADAVGDVRLRGNNACSAIADSRGATVDAVQSYWDALAKRMTTLYQACQSTGAELSRYEGLVYEFKTDFVRELDWIGTQVTALGAGSFETGLRSSAGKNVLMIGRSSLDRLKRNYDNRAFGHARTISAEIDAVQNLFATISGSSGGPGGEVLSIVNDEFKQAANGFRRSLEPLGTPLGNFRSIGGANRWAAFVGDPYFTTVQPSFQRAHDTLLARCEAMVAAVEDFASDIDAARERHGSFDFGLGQKYARLARDSRAWNSGTGHGAPAVDLGWAHGSEPAMGDHFQSFPAVELSHELVRCHLAGRHLCGTARRAPDHEQS